MTDTRLSEMLEPVRACAHKRKSQERKHRGSKILEAVLGGHVPPLVGRSAR